MLSARLLGLSLFLSACVPAGREIAAPPAPAKGPPACASPAACEQRASARLDAARHDPAALTALLRRFPKGGDLHNHMAGAVYAESYIGWARADGLRLDDKLKVIDPSKCGPDACSELPASPADARFDALVRAWSMKDFVPGGTESGHDHFFGAFSRFGLLSHMARHEGPMLAETMRRAADEGAIYLETMISAARPLVTDIARAAGALDPLDLPAFARKLRADPRWGELVKSSRRAIDELEREARGILRCSTPEASAGCALTVRYLGQVSRSAPAPQVFAELLAAFEIGKEAPRLVGVNLVSPEDRPTALQDYDLHMSMLGLLGGELRDGSPLHVTLHAGELVQALVPAAHPEHLETHVRKAVEIARAERIGHGVAVLEDRSAPALLAEMRARGVTVEICLTSNATILGVSGSAHPLAAYLAAGVPVTLATDDPGVSRSSLTAEYARAVGVQGITYPQLKAMARRSLTAAFVPGASLWASPEGGRPVEACAGALGAARPEAACAAFLATSERARLEWTLEGQLAAFERE